MATTYAIDRGDVRRAADLTNTPIEVLVLEDGTFAHYQGTSPRPGAFEIPNVPAGKRYVRVGSTYLVTQADQIDLGEVAIGRPDRTPDPQRTARVEFKLDGLEPGRGDDLFQVVSPDVGIFTEWYARQEQTPQHEPSAQPGRQAFDLVFTFDNLISAGRKDRVYVTQLAARSSPTSEAYHALGRAYVVPMFSSEPGATQVIGPASMVVPPEVTRSFRWQRSDFDKPRQVNPAARLLLDKLYVSAYPWHPTVSASGATPDLFIARRDAPGDDVSFGEVTFGNPFPSNWTLWVMHWSSFQVPLSSQHVTFEVTASMVQWEPLVREGGTQVIQPRVTPVRAPLINGASAFDEQSGVGDIPILSWDAPRVGSSASYHVSIGVLEASSGKPAPRWIADIYTTERTVRLPDKLLEHGKRYVAMITAIVAPGDRSTRPLKPKPPTGRADVITGVFAP